MKLIEVIQTYPPTQQIAIIAVPSLSQMTETDLLFAGQAEQVLKGASLDKYFGCSVIQQQSAHCDDDDGFDYIEVYVKTNK